VFQNLFFWHQFHEVRLVFLSYRFSFKEFLKEKLPPTPLNKFFGRSLRSLTYFFRKLALLPTLPTSLLL
jgi:hypothetical protein